ncbi:MAG: TadE/TadG family type IV pilus assembly protein [Terriglobales bacterium]
MMRRGKHNRGQAIAEMAVLLPLLLLLLVGVEELGRLAYTAIVASNAAHAGALYGSQNNVTVSDNAGMQSQALADGKDITSLTATATHVCTCASGASAPDCSLSDCSSSRLQVYAQVNTTAVFTPVCSFLGWPGPITLHEQARVRAQQ